MALVARPLAVGPDDTPDVSTVRPVGHSDVTVALPLGVPGKDLLRLGDGDAWDAVPCRGILGDMAPGFTPRNVADRHNVDPVTVRDFFLGLPGVQQMPNHGDVGLDESRSPHPGTHGGSPFEVHVAVVVQIRAEEEVGGITAGGIVALVTDEQGTGVDPGSIPIGDSIGQIVLADQPNLPPASPERTSGPRPTGRGIADIHPRPEAVAFGRCHRRDRTILSHTLIISGEEDENYGL